MGGLSKKAYQINILDDKKALPAVLLDAGNMLFKQDTVSHSQELLTAAGLREIYQLMAYDAVAVGSHDLAAGIEFLKNGKLGAFPWLSANLMDKLHRPIFPAAKIITRGAIKIGIIGMTGQIPTASQEIIVADWRKVLPDHLQRLTKECQLVIVLSNLAAKDNTELTRQFPQVHLLISADRQQGNIVPRVDNSTLVTQTMNQGKYLGVLDLDWIPGSSWAKDREQERQSVQNRLAELNRQLLRLEQQKGSAASGDQEKLRQMQEEQQTTSRQMEDLTRRIASEKENSPALSSFNCNFIALNKNLPDDKKIAARIEEIKLQIYTHNQKLATPVKQQQNVADNPSFAGLAGSSRCQECHPLQSQFWNTTRHAAAYATLQRQQQNFNLDCLPCHITQNPASNHTGPSPVESLLTLPPSLQSVGCEACHGAGLAHADTPDKIKLHKKVEEKICLACHTKERDPDFDYRLKSPKISCPAGQPR